MKFFRPLGRNNRADSYKQCFTFDHTGKGRSAGIAAGAIFRGYRSPSSGRRDITGT